MTCTFSVDTIEDLLRFIKANEQELSDSDFDLVEEGVHGYAQLVERAKQYFVPVETMNEVEEDIEEECRRTDGDADKSGSDEGVKSVKLKNLNQKTCFLVSYDLNSLESLRPAVEEGGSERSEP